jgi:Predicted outer membrane protein
MIVATIITTLFTSTVPVMAEELTMLDRTGYDYTGVAPQSGYVVVHNNIPIMKIDGRVVFCVESGIFTSSGGGYYAETYIDSKKDILSKIAYYGYTNTSRSNYDYAVTQVMIWNELGDEYVSSTIPNLNQRKAEIMAMVNNHDVLPSWHNQEVSVQVGNSITLEDTNNIFQGMILKNKPTATTLNATANKLTITPSATSTNGTITYQKVENHLIGTSIVYKKPAYQTLVEFHLESNKETNIKVNIIKLGNVKVQKIDEDTNKPLAGATIKLEYGGTVAELITDENGIVEIKDIPQGTEIMISEVTAPHGFVNKGELKKIVIEPNKTIEVRLDNKAQQGILNLTKTGNQLSNVEITESEYGDLYNFEFSYQPLAGVTYDIEALEDIVVGGTTHAKQGDIVTSVTTGSNGELINMPKLYLGKYQAIEKSAPNGFLVDSTPIPFTFTYEGQEISLVSQSVTATNDFQKLELNLFKNEEAIKNWKGNIPYLESILANDKVFGLYTNEEISINGIVIPDDSLLHYETVKNGKLVLSDLQYPNGNYYFQELDAGTHHKLDTKKYEFEFTANSDTPHQVISINDEETALLNELHFNIFSLKKLNEVATLEEKLGYQYDYTGNGKGAIFTLSDEAGNVIHTVTVNDNSLATFHYIPVGTFFVKEKKPSSSEYLSTDRVWKIISSKDGIQVYDEQETLISNQSSEEHEILFEVENDLIKGTAQLTKTDIVTGKALPNTKVRILDDNKAVIIEGKTDDNGIFIFETLPKGIYYFQEYEAPSGYQLDETPIRFEIKKNDVVVKVSMTNQKIPAPTSLPQTGVKDNVIIYVGLLLLSTGTLIYVYRKKNQVRDNDE